MVVRSGAPEIKAGVGVGFGVGVGVGVGLGVMIGVGTGVGVGVGAGGGGGGEESHEIKPPARPARTHKHNTVMKFLEYMSHLLGVIIEFRNLFNYSIICKPRSMSRQIAP